MNLVECVPNISEGKNLAIIQEITDLLNSLPNVFLLNVDSNEAANRTVFTFVVALDNLKKVSLLFFKKVTSLIDMRLQKGTHPRIGAVDVFPVIPLNDAYFDKTLIELDELAVLISEELGLPIYLYEESARKEERKKLEYCRKGEYEGAQEKLISSNGIADFGRDFNSKTGISILGVRKFLVAFNLNLKSNSVKNAKIIAQKIRESGFKGEKGLLKNVKAIGWYIDDFKRAQLSTNITDYKVTSVFKLWDTAQNIANSLGDEITGSELIGLIPMEAIQLSVKEKRAAYNDKDYEIIDYFENYLNLNEVKKFERRDNILDYRLEALKL